MTMIREELAEKIGREYEGWAVVRTCPTDSTRDSVRGVFKDRHKADDFAEGVNKRLNKKLYEVRHADLEYGLIDGI
ncbi:MAG: hypothetical protein WC551_13235 [Patescibacteria group bacterium]